MTAYTPPAKVLSKGVLQLLPSTEKVRFAGFAFYQGIIGLDDLVAIVAEQPLQIGSHLVQRILTGFSQCLQEEEASFQVVILIAINECTINGVDACFPIPIVEERLGVIKALGALGLWEHGVAE